MKLVPDMQGEMEGEEEGQEIRSFMFLSQVLGLFNEVGVASDCEVVVAFNSNKGSQE